MIKIYNIKGVTTLYRQVKKTYYSRDEPVTLELKKGRDVLANFKKDLLAREKKKCIP